MLSISNYYGGEGVKKKKKKLMHGKYVRIADYQSLIIWLAVNY